MIRLRPAVKRDANHNAVVAALRACGAVVVDLASQGSGCPDILVGWKGAWLLVEIKDGAKKPSETKLRVSQKAFFVTAKSKGLPCHVVKSEADALALLGVKNYHSCNSPSCEECT